jgi:hypothetical protein
MGRLKGQLVATALALAPRRGRVAVAVVCPVLAGCAAFPSLGLASTTIGSDLTAAANTGRGCSPCVITFANTSLPAGAPPLTSPLTGTIVRWRLKTGPFPGVGTIQLRVLAPAGAGQFTGAGTGPSETIPTTATTTPFSAQLPIAAGDSIGVDATLANFLFNTLFAFAAPRAGANAAQWSPSLADGATAAPTANAPNEELLVNADVAALPTSSVAIPACSTSGTVTATVTSDPDPAVEATAIHFRIDGGPEQTQATSGNPGSAAIPVPDGSHTLEYWGEDSVGGLESPHNTATVVGCSATPGGTTPGGTTPGGTTTPGGAASAGTPAGTATTPGGTTPGTTPPASAALATMSDLSQTNSVFRVGAQSTPLAGLRARSVPRGTTFSFRLDQPAVVTVLVQQKLPGRRVGRVCKRPTHGLRKRPRCTRLVTKATLQRNANVGLNRIAFSGRIRGRALPPGRYRAAFTAANTAGTSGPSALSFRIVR